LRKTTTAAASAGSSRPREGRFKDITRRHDAISTGATGSQIVFQILLMNPRMRVGDIVEEPDHPSPVRASGWRVRELFESLASTPATSGATRSSGGQRQRIGMAGRSRCTVAHRRGRTVSALDVGASSGHAC
jgi:ABC-type dipeptide/oligopeptide/nickel transport system ATPase subunit